MNRLPRTSFVFAAALAVLPWAASVGSAQYYQYPVTPPPIYAPYAGAGGQLAGAAQVIGAQGQYMQDQEQARITREQAFQANLESKKAAVEYSRWLEANTPTYTE